MGYVVPKLVPVGPRRPAHDILTCPSCKGPVRAVWGNMYRCQQCGQTYDLEWEHRNNDGSR
jgi:tRNA(Ile2) C34 agmatinyltransferase TiaS